MKGIIFPALFLIVIVCTIIFRILRTKKTVLSCFTLEAFRRLDSSKMGLKRVVEAIILLVSSLLLLHSLFLPLEGGGRFREGARTGGSPVSLKMVFLVDVSLSMISKDAAPSRLERAKMIISGLIQKNQGSSFALVPFAGGAFIQCPFTRDGEIIHRYLEVIRHGAVPRGGSCLSSGLKMVLRLFNKEEKSTHTKRHLIILTDGADYSGEEPDLYAKIAEAGIRTTVIGIGGEKPVPIVFFKDPGSGRDIVKRDSKQNVVLTRLDSRRLKRVASRMKGRFVTSLDEFKFSEGKGSVLSGETKTREMENIDKKFFFFVSLPMLLLLVGSFFTGRLRKRLKWVGRFESQGLVFILSFVCGKAFAATPVDLFNQSVDFALEKKYKKAISVLEEAGSTIDSTEKGVRFQYHYQLGTMYCLVKRIKPCIQELKQAFLLNPGNGRVRRNLEIAYSRLPPGGTGGPPNVDRKDRSTQRREKKRRFEERFRTGIKSLRYSEQNVFRRQFQKQIQPQDRRFLKDW